MIRVVADGMLDLGKYIETAPVVTGRAAAMAINSIIKGKGFSQIKQAMTDEIAFPAGYLSGDRLRVTQQATENNLMGIITGRKRATSLARFASSSDYPGKKSAGITVRVQAGKTTYLKGAFLVRLKKGASLTEDSYNIGLAVRLRPGETIVNKKSTHKSWLVPGKVALLYGPSVDQVFATVADDQAPKLAEMTANEFTRQFARLTGG